MAATDTAAQERRRSAGTAPGDSPSAGTASPKRVSFAPQPPPLRPASTGNSPMRRPMRHGMLPPSLTLDGSGSGLSMLSSAADHSLVFIPEVDSPRRHSTLRPLGACTRWPSNDALSASDEEINLRVDMSDLPPDALAAPPTPTAAASLALAVLDLLPRHPRSRSLRRRSCEEAAAPPPRAGWGARRWSVDSVAAAAQAQQDECPGEGTPYVAEPAAELAEAEAGEKEAAEEPGTPVEQPEHELSAFEAAAAAAEAEKAAPAQQAKAPRHRTAWLGSLLGRLLSAAGTSGQGIAELAASGSGTLGTLSGGMLSTLDSASSADSIYSARSSANSGAAAAELRSLSPLSLMDGE